LIAELLNPAFYFTCIIHENNKNFLFTIRLKKAGIFSIKAQIFWLGWKPSQKYHFVA